MRFFLSLLLISFMASCKHDPVFPKVENPDTTLPVINGVCFNTEILPVFVSNCAMSGCHDAISHKSGYNLTTYDGIMSGIVPYKPDNGKIIQSMLEKDPQKIMPPAGALSKTKMDLIRQWISEGAGNVICDNECDTLNVTYTTHIASIVGANCGSCHSESAYPYSGGGINLGNYTAVKLQVQSGTLLCAINHEGNCSPMPQDRDKLTNCDIHKFQKWLSIGCPN